MLSKRRAKYGASPTTVDGVRFASKAEAKRDGELLTLEKFGKIRGLRRQPKFDMVVQGEKICRYVADWEYLEGNKLVVEDRKGVQTQVFKLKWKLAKALYPHIEWRLS